MIIIIIIIAAGGEKDDLYPYIGRCPNSIKKQQMQTKTTNTKNNPKNNKSTNIFPTTSMLRVSFSPVPECVVAGGGIEFFRPPRAPRNSVIIIVVLVVMLYLAQRTSHLLALALQVGYKSNI